MQQLRQLFNGSLPAAIFFDLDGTLLDSVPDLAQAVDAMLADLQLPLAGEDNVRHWVGNGASKLVERACVHGGVSGDNALQAKALDLFLEHYGQLPERRSELYVGVAESLAALHAAGIKMALITNKPMRFVPELLQNFVLDGYFSLVLGGDSLAEKKPSSEPLLYACDFFALPIEQCLMVGDSANDVQAAQACGMASVSVSYGYNYGQDASALGASWHIEAFAELLR